jgi:signal-transduction protein with cAMP-binding, CBS, and nucleotidyltransferase domain
MAKFDEQTVSREFASAVSFIDYATPISKARRQLRGEPAIIVNRNGEYYGILDTKSLAEWGSLKLQGSEKAGKLAVKAPRVSSSTSIGDMAYYFYKLRIKSLPYYHGGKIIGVIERSTLLKMLLSLRALDGMSVMQAMSSPVLAIDSHASLAQALSSMVRSKVNRLVVLENGRFTGIITNHDIHARYTRGDERLPGQNTRMYKPSNIAVDSVMEKNVDTTTRDSTLADAARQMVENKVTSLVVTKSNNPFGILTISDILEKIVATRRAEAKRVFVSGFDEYTYQYEESVIEELKALMSQVEKMHELPTDYATVRIKRIKHNSYEMQARISLGKYGTLRVHSDGASFHDAFSALMKRFKATIIKEKENIVSSRRRLAHGVEYGE